MRRLTVILFALPLLCFCTPAFAQADVPAPAAAADVQDAPKDASGDAAKDVAADVSKDTAKASDASAAKDAAKAPTKKPPENLNEAVEDVSVLIEAAKSGNWPLFAGILLMLLVFVLDKLVDLKAKVGKKAMPWVAAGLGIVGTMGVTLTDGSITWWWGLIQGLLAGASAVGLWELVGKHALKKKKEEAPAG
jgi:hypothetical protein